MTDVSTEAPDKVLQIPITKASTKDSPFAIGVSMKWLAEQCPADLYEEIMLQGMKILLNRGMSKITGKEAGALAAAKAKAEENWTKLQSGEFRKTGGKSKVSGAVKTEAMRLARIVVKEEMKAQGLKVSHYSAKAITEAAKSVLEERPDLLVQAEENLAKAARVATEGGEIKSVVSALKADPELVAKANAKKKQDKVPLSAAQAGKVAQRSKTEARPN